MKVLGDYGHKFPATRDEALTWQPTRRRHVLARRVMAVAHTRIEGAWCAYIDAVPGEDHAHEMDAVISHGTKLGAEMAETMFPQFVGVPYAT